jgi:hypothetical protein
VTLPYKGLLGSLLEASFAQLERISAEIEKSRNRPLKSTISPEIKQFDDERDVLFEDVKRNVKVAAKSSDSLKGSAGQNLMLFMKPYWDAPKQALNTETDMISEFISRCNSEPNVTSYVDAIGIAPLLAQLGEANKHFEALYFQRNAELAAKIGPAGQFKPEAVRNYNSFCRLLEQSRNLTPSEEFNTLFDQLNNLRKTYHALLPKVKGKKGSEEGTAVAETGATEE